MSLESSNEPTILIHGGAWKVKHVRDEALWCQAQTWQKHKWESSPALVHKVGATTSQYNGQRFDPDKIDLVQDGWTHDHCEICSWTLRESDDPDEGEGYRNEGNSWLCTECYNQFIRDDKLSLKTNSEQGATGQPVTPPRVGD